MDDPMASVWVVTEGEYSDYGIMAVFADESIAEAHAREVKGDVEKYPLLDIQPSQMEWFSAHLRLNEEDPGLYVGSVCEKWCWDYDYSAGYTRGATVSVRRTAPWRDNGRLRPGYYNVAIHSLDKHAVEKKASEMLARWRAAGYRLVTTDNTAASDE